MHDVNFCKRILSQISQKSKTKDSLDSVSTIGKLLIQTAKFIESKIADSGYQF